MTTLNLAHLVVAREIYVSFEDVYLTPLGMSSASHKCKDASWLSIQTKRLGFQSFKDGGRGRLQLLCSSRQVLSQCLAAVKQAEEPVVPVLLYPGSRNRSFHTFSMRYTTRSTGEQ
jgi:hypothetical protein